MIIAVAIVAVVIVAAVGDVVSPSVVVVVVVAAAADVLHDGQNHGFGVGHTTHALASDVVCVRVYFCTCRSRSREFVVYTLCAHELRMRRTCV